MPTDLVDGMGEAKRRKLLGVTGAKPRGKKDSEIMIGGAMTYDKAIRIYDEDAYGLMLDIPFPESTAAVSIKPPKEYMIAMFRIAGLCRRDIHRVFPQITHDSGPPKLEALLTATKEVVSRRAAPLIQNAMDKEKNECGAKCSMCCHQDLDILVPEAALIARHLLEAADTRSDKVRQRAREIEAGSPSGSSPCPLLGEDGECTAYDVRPLVCRQYFSTSRQRCIDAFAAFKSGVGDKNVQTYADPQFVGRAHMGGIMGVCKDAGVQHGMVPMATAVTQILNDPSILDRWANGERVFVREEVGVAPPQPKMRFIDG